MTRQRWKRHRIVAAVVAVGLGAPVAAAAAGQGTTDYGAGVPEPVLSELTGSDVRIPNSDPVADDGEQLNLVGEVESRDALGATSLTGHEITRVSDPHDDLADALDALEDAAAGADAVAAASAAAEIDAILQGTTEGRIYDGFDLLNRNRGAITADHVPGEYKMKRLRDSGETATSVDGVDHRIWEVDVNMLWYGSEFDADTFLLRVPVEADGNDLLRVNYRIYSLVREDFSPTSARADFRAPGSVPFPYAGLDSVWQSIGSDTVTEITVDHPPLRLLRGIYTWGWREHPPRIQFLQPVFEIVNAHTGEVELEPAGRSFAERNRLLGIDDIGAAAPEKKMHTVAR
ncbi:MAG: hypothetical protein ACE5GB_05870, partial [Acidimicrobiales bacterium]